MRGCCMQCAIFDLQPRGFGYRLTEQHIFLGIESRRLPDGCYNGTRDGDASGSGLRHWRSRMMMMMMKSKQTSHPADILLAICWAQNTSVCVCFGIGILIRIAGLTHTFRPANSEPSAPLSLPLNLHQLSAHRGTTISLSLPTFTLRHCISNKWPNAMTFNFLKPVQ